jgi:3-oxoacyl-[acyl-carrier-protein] synthase II
MTAYIQSAAAISPQHTFQTDSFLSDPRQPVKGYFTCIHPDYREFIPPVSLRRMSTVIRMGLAASIKCLEAAGPEPPEAVIIGTGLGCISDTTRFLEQMIRQGEQMLNPTAFIQSTHNTVAGQIALILGCKGYNMTFTQKSISFETALLDALLLLDENNNHTALVGGIDEITEESFHLMVRAGCVKKWNGGDILNSTDTGAVAGEGSTFFFLSDRKMTDTLARIDDLEIINRCAGQGELHNRLDRFLERNGLQTGDIDLLVSGRNGDPVNRGYHLGMEARFSHSIVAGYKHLTGEYDTSSAFGTYLASWILRNKRVPEAVHLNSVMTDRAVRGLVFNHSKGRDFCFTLVSDPHV